MKKFMEWSAANLLMIALVCLTLGLAPFTPPHVWHKITWIAAGAEGMRWFDYFDLLLHGSPWVLLLLGVFGKLKSGSEAKQAS